MYVWYAPLLISDYHTIHLERRGRQRGTYFFVLWITKFVARCCPEHDVAYDCQYCRLKNTVVQWFPTFWFLSPGILFHKQCWSHVASQLSEIYHCGNFSGPTWTFFKSRYRDRSQWLGTSALTHSATTAGVLLFHCDVKKQMKNGKTLLPFIGSHPNPSLTQSEENQLKTYSVAFRSIFLNVFIRHMHSWFSIQSCGNLRL